MMSTIETAIDRASDDLRWISGAIASIGSAGTLSNESFDFFRMSSQLLPQLENAKSLLPVRDAALQALLAFPTQVSRTSPDLFLYNGIDVTFKIGRYLLFQNYAVTTWALYDTVSKVSGLLCGNDDLSKNFVKPAKLYEDFLQGKTSVGARVRDHLKGGYGWPIALSYKIRNWLTHDGHSHDGSEMFKYDSPLTGSEFEMLDSAWDIVVRSCKGDPAQTRLTPFPDVKANLAIGLQTCNTEVDEAAGFLLTWSTGIARLQAALLFPRDMTGPATIAPVAHAAVATVTTTP